MDGLFSTIKFGLVSCHNAFGDTLSEDGCPSEEGTTDAAAGKLLYSIPDGMSVDEAIDDLGLLLTAGRLSSTNKNIIKGAIDNEYNYGDRPKATRIAQQLILSSPEFHSWGTTHDNSGSKRSVKGYRQPPKHSYKSIVFYYMEGGAELWNLIVPMGGCQNKDMYAEYKRARGRLAIPTSKLLEIDASTSNSLCNTWGIHENMPLLRDLYNDGDATFILNMGILGKRVSIWMEITFYSALTHCTSAKPLTKFDRWGQEAKIRLFAHNHMTYEQFYLDPHRKNPGTGVLGRMLDILKKNGYQTSANTVDGSSKIMLGDSFYGNSPVTVTSGSLDRIDKYSTLSQDKMLNLVKEINGQASEQNSLFGEQWAQRVSEVLFEYKSGLELHEGLINGDFDIGNYKAVKSEALQLQSVARYMQSRHLRKIDREAFFVSQRGFDLHAHAEDLPGLYDDANVALKSFVEYLKREALWDDTVIILSSDFGRSIAPNSNKGSDHAWGGKFMSFSFLFRKGCTIIYTRAHVVLNEPSKLCSKR